MFLLLFNTLGALYGGISLVLRPDGSSLKMPLALLENSPFSSYLIPGFILLLTNGLFGLIVYMATIFKWKHFAMLIILQGIFLTGWVSVQIFLIGLVFPLQPIMLAIGILILLLGLLESGTFRNLKQKQTQALWK